MNRKFQIRNSENTKRTLKAPLKVHLEKLSLECISSRTSQGGFVSGMTLDQYFSTMRQTTQNSNDSEHSSLELGVDKTIREIEEENESSCYENGSSQNTARALQTNRESINQIQNNTQLKVKLPALGHQSFTKMRKVEIPHLSLAKKQQQSSLMRSLYGSTTFKKPPCKTKKQNMKTQTTLSFENKLKKRILTRREKSELIPLTQMKCLEGDLSVAETTSRRQ